MRRNEWWDAWGPVRGSCEHHHRTEAAAERCAFKDVVYIAQHTRGHAYSDRAPRKHPAIER